MEEHILFSKIQQGDAGAFEWLYKKYHPFVMDSYMIVIRRKILLRNALLLFGNIVLVLMLQRL